MASIPLPVSLLVLLFLFLGIFALLGTQVFGGKFKERKSPVFGYSKPRANFDSFVESFFAVFQVWRWIIVVNIQQIGQLMLLPLFRKEYFEKWPQKGLGNTLKVISFKGDRRRSFSDQIMYKGFYRNIWFHQKNMLQMKWTPKSIYF